MKYPLLKYAAILSLVFVSSQAHAIVMRFEASLSGPAESPPNVSPGTGTATVWVDTVAQTLRLKTSFSGLLGTVTAAHIHAATAVANTGTAGVATQTPTFAGFPSGVTSGSYDQTFDLTLASSFNAAFVAANGGTAASASTALVDALVAEKAYLNIHTSQFGGGEIRGFLAQVPDAGSTALLLGAALLGVFGYARQFRSR